MSKTHYKTLKNPKQLISEVVAIIGFIVLSFFFSAESKVFDEITWQKDAEIYHLGSLEKNIELWKDYEEIIDVRKNADLFIKHQPKYDACLNRICENPVGFTALRLMIAKMKHQNIAPIEIREHKKRCCFNFKDRCIYMAESFFNKQDIGIVQICAINEEKAIIPVEFSRIEALFHELCHAFHYISGTRKENNDKQNLELIYRNAPRGIELWQGNRECDEEFYTITGINNQTYDPINSNIFDAYESISHKKPIRQRSIYKAYSLRMLLDPDLEKVIEATLPILEYPKKYFIDIV